MNYTWITQGSFLLESQNFRLAIDPYLSDFVEKEHGLTRLQDPAFTVDSLKPDAVFCTHNHIDHFDPIAMPQIAEQYSNCRYAGPVSVVEKCREFKLPMDQVTQITIGDTIQLGPFSITALPAIHSDKDAVGALIEVEGKTIFISGDSDYSDEYSEAVAAAAKDADLALICINGRMGNMNEKEALKVIQAIKPTCALPMHYGLFAENTADPQPFIDDCKNIGVESFMMEQGTIYKLN